MSDYTKVYDPNDVMFEIPHERAALLVLNSGWSWKKKSLKVIPPAPVEPLTTPTNSDHLPSTEQSKFD